jgi:predicted DNA-binding transcriptional regulator YafY
MRKWSKEDILFCVNEKLKEKTGETISEPSLRKDLIDMELELNAPIERYKEGRKYFYKYEYDWSIKNIPIENEDMAKLNLAVDILKQIQGFVLADEIEEIVKKIEKKTKISSDKKNFIAFANPPSAKGTSNLGDIYEAIINERILKISYQHFKASTPDEQTIHPYYLKEFNNRWYLFGWSEQKERVEQMALDRMTSIKVTNGSYKENSFNAEKYFANIIGVTNMGNEMEKIRLAFNRDRAKYAITRKLHSSQIENEMEDGRVLIELDLQVNRELIALILSYGEDVEVLAPSHLRTTISEKLNAAANGYSV